LDTSLLLDTDDTRLFQNLIGVAQWIAQLGRFDIRPPLIDHGSVHSHGEPDFSAIYPDSSEDLDPKLPVPLRPELEITGVMDSDHAHDHMTRRSVSGILLFVGRTPVMAFSKRQGAVQARPMVLNSLRRVPRSRRYFLFAIFYGLSVFW
jgi:hypothetical protein